MPIGMFRVESLRQEWRAPVFPRVTTSRKFPRVALSRRPYVRVLRLAYLLDVREIVPGFPGVALTALSDKAPWMSVVRQD
jgi:hypothetical protein